MFLRSFLSALFWLVLSHLALADGRVALVIGNATYDHAPTLANPVTDAKAINDRLTELGFDVTLIENLKGHETRRVLGQFSAKAHQSEIALVYYAGHGIELSGENYLIPVDACLETEAEAEFETVPLRDVLRAAKGASKLSLVMLDACRDNPFAGRIKRHTGTRSLGRGFALVDVEEKGMLVSFAAEAGKTADDGNGEHSPYTQAVLEVLEEPGVEIGFVFRKVRNRVRSATNGRQVPIERMQLPDEAIYLVPPLPEVEPEPEVVTVFVPKPVTVTLPAEKPDPEIVTVFVPKPMAMPAAPVDPTPAAQPEPAAPKPPTEAERLEAAITVNTPRAWALFISQHGTNLLSRADVVKRLNGLGVQVNRAKSRGEVFERILKLDKATRRDIQAGLNAHGIDVGTADGSFGPRSRNGIKAFQKRNGVEETGFVDAMLLERLLIRWEIPVGASWVSGEMATQQDAKALQILGEDPKLVAFLECADWYDVVYGKDRNSYYIAVLERMSTVQADRTASKCGAFMATIADKHENQFIYDMLQGDKRFFQEWNANGTQSKNGPYFGLMQPFGSGEPRDGWHWLNGEPLTFVNWRAGQPNEHKPGHDHAHFYGERKGKGDFDSIRADRWNDNAGAYAHAHILEITIDD